MKNLIAIIEEGKVHNIIVASNEYASTLQQETANVTGKKVGIGYTYANGEFSAPPIPELTLEEKTEKERSWRDGELKATDYILPLTDHPQHAAYLEYRQLLRDWPASDDFPTSRPQL